MFKCCHACHLCRADVGCKLELHHGQAFVRKAGAYIRRAAGAAYLFLRTARQSEDGFLSGKKAGGISRDAATRLQQGQGPIGAASEAHRLQLLCSILLTRYARQDT